MAGMLGAVKAGEYRLEVDSVAHAPPDWDEFVRHTAAGTCCHLEAWGRIIADVLKHEAIYLCARDQEGALRGVLPLVRLRSRVPGRYLVSMPFVNDGGPLGDRSVRAHLAAAAVAYAQSHRIPLLELRSRELVPGPTRLRARKISVHLALPASVEELWAGFPSKLRSQVRRPAKEGMQARFGAAELEGFYQVFARNMRDLGTPVLPRRFFQRIVAELEAYALVGAVYHGGEPVAGGIGFRWRDELEITWASSLRAWNRFAPNMLLYHAFLESAIRRGARTFNFGRCTAGASTHRFKLQWGGHDVVLPWAQWSPRLEDASPPSGDARTYRLAAALWRRLPVPLANRLGPALARRLP